MYKTKAPGDTFTNTEAESRILQWIQWATGSLETKSWWKCSKQMITKYSSQPQLFLQYKMYPLALLKFTITVLEQAASTHEVTYIPSISEKTIPPTKADHAAYVNL